MSRAARAVVLAAIAAVPAHAQTDAATPEANGLVRLFSDSKGVLVRSWIEDVSVPLRGAGSLTVHWNNERVSVPGVQAPPGSAQAVDAITTASRPISGNAYQDYTKVRNELEGTVTRGNATFGYYHSMESDYLAHQVSASYARDLRDQSLNLSVGSSWGWDDIEPLADARTNATASRKETLHWNAVATQVLGPESVLRYGLEYNRVDGLQHNPYRLVYAGGTTVPERHPDTRDRGDAFVKYHQYLPNRSSLQLDYRFYDDDWGIVSHEVQTGLSQYLVRGCFARYEYRWYTQSAADFWRTDYTSATGVDGYRTGDYRMGPLSSHLFGFTLNADLGVMAPASPRWRQWSLTLDYERYFNSNSYSADILETGVAVHF
jgi:hypothetical protein